MLQQTQVDRVIAFYERFVSALPTVSALARAPLERVLHLSSGLGYYSRARNLRRAAQVIVAQHGGRFPDSFAVAQALPGIGDYTAGAILSIAYGRQLPALDANATRVLRRVFRVHPTKRESAQARLRRLGQAAVPADRPGDYNQALMELGALVCMPRNPGCDTCCLGDVCKARRYGERALASSSKRQQAKAGRAVVGVVWRGHRVLIAARPPEGVWAGLWVFPGRELNSGEAGIAPLKRALCDDFGLDVEVGEELARFSYGIMSRRIGLTVHVCRVGRGRTSPRQHVRARWAKPAELGEFAFPLPHRRVAELVRNPTPSGRR
jgi:A/G-specific adenine glycosylase